MFGITRKMARLLVIFIFLFSIANITWTKTTGEKVCEFITKTADFCAEMSFKYDCKTVSKTVGMEVYRMTGDSYVASQLLDLCYTVCMNPALYYQVRDESHARCLRKARERAGR